MLPMRIARGKMSFLLSLLALPLAVPLAGAHAGEARNPALPEATDLVVLDEYAAPAAAPGAPPPGDAVQRAFPVLYGTATAVVSSAIHSTVINPDEITPPPVAAAAPPAADPFGGSGTPAAPAFGEPLPLPPPAELLVQGAGALPAARGAAEPVPSIGLAFPAGGAAPPLPELAARPAAPATADDVSVLPAAPVPVGDAYFVPPPPATLEQVQAEFNTLKTYCEADHLGSAAEIYSRMPDFGKDDQINRLRADAANLLILGLARDGNLDAARRVYESVPPEVDGFDARLAKARAVINLATYCIRAGRHADAFDVLMDAGKIQNRSALNNELFRLMARMIPYLDNAEETEKAGRVYDLLLSEVKSPGTAALFAENVRASVLPYYFQYVDNSDSPVHRRKRLDVLEHIFSSLDPLANNEDVLALRRTLGRGLAERYAGDPDRAERFEVD